MPPKEGGKEPKKGKKQKPLERDATFKEKEIKIERERFKWSDLLYIDFFGYEPVYSYKGYRSKVGTASSVLLWFCVFTRVVTTFIDFFDLPPLITETEKSYAPDDTEEKALPMYGVSFKRTGWKAFYDPTYFTIQFQQGMGGQAGNLSYSNIGNEPCSFVDSYGRIVSEEVRCPSKSGDLLGSFYDKQFRFTKISLLRCHNGTTIEGKPKPGPCKPAEEIDELIWSGTYEIFIEETDLDIAFSQPTTRLRHIKKEFTSGVHLGMDLLFQFKLVVQRPRYFFDRYSLFAQQKFTTFEAAEDTLTNFQGEKIGKWNKPEAAYVPLYASIFLMLGTDQKLQIRSWLSVFSLIESWGSSFAFFYLIFSVTAIYWNTTQFQAQVKGVDLRDLHRNQFNKFGRLIDRSFQMPRELQDLSSKSVK